MYHVNEMLNNGDHRILEYFKQAKNYWEIVLERSDQNDPNHLAQRLSTDQRWFEHNCGGRYLGQEVMVITGLTFYYSTQYGYEDNYRYAKYIYDAIMQSYCSVEVKSLTQQIGQDYSLVEGGNLYGY